jgi:preprotein translocase subunit SecE
LYRTGEESDMSSRTTSKSSERPGNFGKFQNLVRDTYTEIKKVTWPDQETTRNLTILVIVMSAALGILLGLVDYGFRELWEWIPL